MFATSILKAGNAMALNQLRHVVIFLGFCFLLLPLAGHAEQRSCGTHWTGWMKTQDSDKNPCPSQCERGEKLNVRTWGNAPDTQYDFQYQCYFPAPTQSAYASSPPGAPATPGPTASAEASANKDTFPFIRGRVDDVSAANGAWLNWTSKLDPVPQNLRRKAGMVSGIRKTECISQTESRIGDDARILSLAFFRCGRVFSAAASRSNLDAFVVP